jgi:predicted trehalose synthase
LTACASAPPEVVIVREWRPLPAYLLTCPGEPAVPGPSATQADVAAWVLRLAESGERCREALAALATLDAAGR